MSASPSMLVPCWELPSSPKETRPTHVSNSGHISPTKRNPAASHSVRQDSEGKVRVLPAIFLGGGGACGGGAGDRWTCEVLSERGGRVPVVTVHCCPNAPERDRVVVVWFAKYPKSLSMKEI